MATEIKKVLTIDTTDLKEYKKHIEELRGELLVLEKGSEDYVKIEEEITRETQKLNEVLKVGKKEVTAVQGSYNALNKELVEARKAYKALSEQERESASGKEMLAHINDLDKQLKNLDASMGQNFRNVGDYSKQFQAAFRQMGSSAGGLVPIIGKVNSALKLLVANPIGAVFTALTLVIAGVVKALKNSEEQSNRLRAAFAPLQTVTQALSKVFTWMSEQVVKAFEAIMDVMGKVIDKVQKFAEWVGWDGLSNAIDKVNERTRQNNELTQREIALEKKRREAKKQAADLDLEISELRAKIADKDNYNTQQRIEFANKWEQKEKEKLELEKSIAQEEYDLVVARNAQSENSAKDYDAEADAYANLQKVQKDYNEGMRTLNKQKSQLLGLEEKELAALKETIEEVEEVTEDISKYKSKIDELISSIENANTKSIKPDASELQRQADEDIEDYIKRLEKLREAIEETNASQLSIDMTQLEKDAEKTSYWSTIFLDDSKEAMRLAADIEYEIQRQLFEDKIALQRSYLDEYALSEEEKIKIQESINDDMESLYRLDAENYMRLQKQKTQDENQQAKERERIKKQELKTAQAVTGGLGNLFDSLADLAEENSKEQQAFAIMGATVNTLNGIVSAISGAMQLGPIMGPIVGAINSAAVLAAGIANIAKIKKASKGDDSGLSGGTGASAGSTVQSAVGVAPLLNETADISNLQSLNVTQSSDMAQQNIRVTLVESDVTDMQNSIKTKVEESTF